MAGSLARQFGWVTLITALLSILSHLTGARAKCQVDSIFPYTENGNTADTDGFITWGPLPTKSFISTGEYHDGGLGPYFSLAQSFVNSSLPNGLPLAIISGLLDGSYNIMTDYMQIINFSLGYIVCIGIGILFIVLFPIIGIFFCCCRCCGNCGGKRIQNPANNNKCKRLTFGGIVFLHTVFIIVGMICLFVSNSRMTVAIDNIENVYDDSITDANSYIQLLKDQIAHIGSKNFNFTYNVLVRDLQGIDVVMGARVMTFLQRDSNLTEVLDDATALSRTIQTLSTTLNTIDSGVTDVETKVTDLKNSLTTVRADIQNTFTTCGCGAGIDLTTLDSSFDPTAFPSVAGQVSAINNAQASPINSSVESAMTEVTDIPCRLKNESQASIDNVISTLDNFANSGLTSLTSQVDTFSAGINLSSYRGLGDAYFTQARLYDTYRSYAGMGLAGLVLVITLLMLLGVLMGMFFSSVDDFPVERSCMSNSGGNMLIASVILIFIFSWLLMLLTTLTYAVGAPLERWVCQPVSDFRSPLYTQLLDKPGGPLGQGYYIGSLLYGNSSLNITVSGILTDCRDGKSAYNALRLDNFFNIDSVLDYSQYVDVTNGLGPLQSRMNISVDILTPELEGSLQDVKDAINLDTTTFLTELNRDLTNTNLPAFAQSLRDLGDQLVASQTPTLADAQARRMELYNQSATLDSINGNQLQNLQTAVADLKTNVTAVDTSKAQIVIEVDNLNASLRITQNYLNADAGALLTREVNNYVYRLTRVIDSFVAFTGGAVKNDMGKCDIVYNLFADVVTVGICKYTLDAFNSIWLSLGWCIFFFVTSIVFSVKLSKHFRRMKQMEGGPKIPQREEERSLLSLTSLESGNESDLSFTSSQAAMAANVIGKMTDTNTSHTVGSDTIQPSHIVVSAKNSSKVFPSSPEWDLSAQVPVDQSKDTSLTDVQSVSHPDRSSSSSDNNKVGHMD